MKKPLLLLLAALCACATPRTERFRSYDPASLRLDPDQADALENASLKHSWATMFRWWAISSGVATVVTLVSPAYENDREVAFIFLLSAAANLGIALVLDGSAREDFDRATLVPVRAQRGYGRRQPGAEAPAPDTSRSRRVETPDGKVFDCFGAGEAWTCREDGNPDAPLLHCSIGSGGEFQCHSR